MDRFMCFYFRRSSSNFYFQQIILRVKEALQMKIIITTVAISFPFRIHTSLFRRQYNSDKCRRLTAGQFTMLYLLLFPEVAINYFIRAN
jgi:hypothetical protein